MRIFIGLVEVAGNFKMLAQGFRDLGMECSFIDLSYQPFQYGGDDQPNIIIKLAKFFAKKTYFACKNKNYSRIFWDILRRIMRIVVFIWALLNFDVFIFVFRPTFFKYYDLPILKFFNKKVLYVFCGIDARPAYLDGVIMESNSIEKSVLLAKETKKVVKFIEKYADSIIDDCAQFYFHERSFINKLYLGKPIFFNKPSVIHYDKTSKVKILHAPSHMGFKGTNIIRNVIQSLIDEGYSIDFIEVSGQTNQVVLQYMNECDIIIDQAFSDLPLSRVAAEAGFFAKPVILSGYYARQLNNDVSEDIIPPTYYCHPEELKEAVKDLILDPSKRQRMGEMLQKFILERYHPKNVAENYLKVINNEMPEHWFYDPYCDVGFYGGAGLHEERIRGYLKKIIEEFGVEALQLNDKPNILKKMKDFAQTSKRL